MMTQTNTAKKRDGRRADYTDRPLTSEEKAFSAELENYNLLFKYMQINRLDQEEWYDILIIDYLQAVKKYLSNPMLQQYKFSTILFRKLDTCKAHYYRKMCAKKRMPEGGFCSLDYTMEGDNPFSENQIQAWLIDHKSNTEKQVVFKEQFNEFYQKCIICDDFDAWEGGINDYLKTELDLLLEGYSLFQVNKRTEKKYPHGYDVEDLKYDIEGFRRIFREVFNI